MTRVIEPFKQFLDGNADPLVDGWLRFLESGTNNTNKDTFVDVNESIANTNPLQLDAEGRCPDVFGPGAYRVISYTNDLVAAGPAIQIQVKDPVPGTGSTSGQFGDWNAVTAYSEGDVVDYEGSYFISLQNNNTGNLTADEAYWQQVAFIYTYNAYATYSTGDTVLYEELLYLCQTNTAAGESPTTTPTSWAKVNASRVQNLGTMVGGTVDLDLSKYDVFQGTISTAETTFTFSNFAAVGVQNLFELKLTNPGDQVLNFPSTVVWESEVAPTAVGQDTYVFESVDGGVTRVDAYIASQVATV